MKIFQKKGILQKIIMVVLIVLCFNLIIPAFSYADFGGVLYDPNADLLCSIGDAVIYLIEGTMTSTWGDDVTLGEGGFLVPDSDFWGNSKYSDMQTSATGTDIDPDEDFSKGWLGLDNSYYLPVTTYSPEQIFAGKVSGLDINFINPKYSEAEGGSAAKLQTTISSWYVALRNLSVVGLLSVLVYVGIRIIISSTASDKAKYKQLLVDWLIALCILFFLHYIMSFTVTMVDSICTAIGGSGNDTVSIVTTDGTLKTNLLGAARFKTQYKDFGAKVSYLIAYLALVVYTLIFTWFYLKRLLMMAFLTLIAPLVALTYPIDKIQDGKAQAFNSWLKEYVFNALIQPFHLIIYMVFVGAAMDLAETNIIYMIAALGFILPAEKILRGFFGFNKAGSTLGGLVGGAALGSFLGKGIKSLASGTSKAVSMAGGSGNTKQLEGNSGVRYQKSNGGLSGAGLERLMGENGNASGFNQQKFRENSQLNDMPKTPDLLSPEEKLEYARLGNTLDSMEENGAAWGGAKSSQAYRQAQERYLELENKKNGKQDYNTSNNNENNKLSEEELKQGKKLGAINGLKNLAKYHSYGKGRKIARGAGRAVKGVAKFATRKTFQIAGAAGGIALSAVPAAVIAASGGGAAAAFGTMVAGGVVGAKKAENLSNGAINVVSGIPGTVRKEIDVFSGNGNMQKAHDVRQQMKDEKHMAYVKSMMEKEGWKDKKGNEHAPGEIASSADVKERMKRYEGYFLEGLDIDTATKAQKTADKYNIDDEMMAKVASDGAKNEINKGTFHDKKKLEAQWDDEYNSNIKAGKSVDVATKSTDAKFALLADMNNTSYTPKNASNVLKKQAVKTKHPEPNVKQQTTQQINQTAPSNSSTKQTRMGPISSSMNKKGSIRKGMNLDFGMQAPQRPLRRPNQQPDIGFGGPKKN